MKKWGWGRGILDRIRIVGRVRGDMSGAVEETLPALRADVWAKRRDNPMILRMVDWRDCSALDYVPGRSSGQATFVGRRIPAQILADRLPAGGALETFYDTFGIDMGYVGAVHEYMTNSPPMDTVGMTGCRSVVSTPLGGRCYGPDGFMGAVGRCPVVVTSHSRSYDAGTRRCLWEVSEGLTGVTFPFEGTAGHHQEAPKGEPL